MVGSTGEIPPILSESDAVIIAVRDDRIPEVAARLVDEGRLRSGQILLHTSGANPARTILAVALPHVRAVGTLHPLVSFADARVAVEGLREIAFGIEGDEPARAVAERIVRALGARAVILEAENLALYHAGAVIASNYVVALADAARSLLIKAGVPADQALPVLIPLLASVVQNLAQVGLPGALTGPVERGDVTVVERHLGALAARAPELVELYRLVGRDVLRLAREKAKIDPASAARLEALFSGAAPALRRGERPRAGGLSRLPGLLVCGVTSLAFGPALRLISGPVSTLRRRRGSSGMHKGFALRFGTVLALSILMFARPTAAAKPEDVFKGKIIITKNRLPMHFSSPGGFVSALQKGKIDKIWPTEEKGDDKGTWDLEYLAFFAQPLDDSEIQVKFYDITHGGKKYVAGDPQYTRERGSRIFGSSIQLAKPEFDVRKRYMMTIESKGRVIATTSFWLLGKGANYSGKVEFSDADTRAK